MNKVLNRSWFDFDVKEENRGVIIISILALIIPLFLGKLLSLIFGEESLITSNSEVIIGTIVNSLLIVSALNFKGIKKIIGVIIMPSIALILSWLLFEQNSEEIIWMAPGICLGNFALVYTFKKIMVEMKQNYFLTGLIGVILKTLIIFGIFSLLNAFNIFPNDGLDTIKYTMGTMQAFTGILGVLLGYLIYTSYRY